MSGALPDLLSQGVLPPGLPGAAGGCPLALATGPAGRTPGRGAGPAVLASGGPRRHGAGRGHAAPAALPPVSSRHPATPADPGGRRAALLPALLAALLGLLPLRALATESDLCLLAAQDAARLSGVPLSVLLAVTLTETGRTEGGAVRPWPWTVNTGGEGHWFATKGEALAFAEGRLASGATSFDVGCFQVNWRWHGENFVSVEQMFDPLANASYAAGFLASLHAETGDWSAAAGAYHSRTPELASRYRARFDAFRAEAVAAGAEGGRLSGPLAASGPLLAQSGGADPLLPRVNSFPLLRATGAAPRMGSLVPLGDG